MESKAEKLVSLSLHDVSESKMYVKKRSFEVEQTIGSGATSTVLLARYESLEKTRKRKVAIKLFKIEYSRSVETRKMLVNEISILKQISHPNVIKMYEVLLHRTRNGKTFIKGLVFEFCDMGDLYGYLSISTGFQLSHSFIQSVFQQVSRGVAYLHGENIVHNDIKPENILLKSNGLVVLTDFGFAQKGKIPNDTTKSSTVSTESEEEQLRFKSTSKLAKVVYHKSVSNLVHLQQESKITKSKSHTGISSLSKQLRVHSVGGTPRYRAPESVTKLNTEFDGAAADMFGLGVMLFVMLYGRFPDKSPKRQFSKEIERRKLFGTVKGDFWANSFESAPTMGSRRDSVIADDSIEANGVCSQLLKDDPMERINSEELVAHPWVQGAAITGSVRTVRKELQRLQCYRK